MTTEQRLTPTQNFAVTNPRGSSPVVLVCEHATHFIPPALNQLGLTAEAAVSHAAWDPGALALAQGLSRRLDAVLAAACVSRLVYDCNRPPESPDAMLARSEKFDVPGNADLDEAARKARADTYYAPFRDGLADTLAAHSDPVLVTIHSFTRVYLGQTRDTDIGILHDSDTRLADAMLDSAAAHTGLKVRRNDPYGPQDGVTHTLRIHGIAKARPNVMIEVRNDLIDNEASAEAMAAMLAPWIAQACAAAELTGAVTCQP